MKFALRTSVILITTNSAATRKVCTARFKIRLTVVRFRNVLFGKKKSAGDQHNQQRKHSDFFHKFLLKLFSVVFVNVRQFELYKLQEISAVTNFAEIISQSNLHIHYSPLITNCK